MTARPAGSRPKGRPGGPLLLVVLLALPGAPAWAHAPLAGAGDFYNGMLHPVTALEHVLPILALGLYAGQQSLTCGHRMLGLFLLGLAAGLALVPAGLPAPPFLLRACTLSAVLAGLLTASAWPMPAPAALSLAGLYGLLHGFGNALALREPPGALPGALPTDPAQQPLLPWLFLPGVAIAAWLLFFYAFLLASRVRPAWARIGVRVAGSWIAAAGLLAAAFV